MPHALDIENYIPNLKIKKKIAAGAFTASPTGIIEIRRIIEQKPDFYVKIAPDTREANKTIIFADWSHYTYSKSQQQTISAILERLLDEKFDIYIWHNNQFKPLKHIDELGKYKKDISPSRQQDIKRQSFEQLKKPIDEFHILDFEEMRRIFYPDNPSLRACVPVDARTSFELKQYFAQNPPEGIVINCLRENTTDVLSAFYNDFPELDYLSVATDFTELYMHSTEENIYPESLQWGGEQLNDSALENIISIDIDLRMFDCVKYFELVEKFNELMRRMPKLKYLYLETPEYYAIDIPDFTKYLKQLEYLAISSHVVAQKVQLSANDLPRLKEIRFTNLTFHATDLSLFTELKRMSLGSCNFQADLSAPLTQLEYLEMSLASGYYKHDLQKSIKLLQNSPNIKNLVLSEDFSISLPRLNFSKLESCELSSITSENIQTIIDASPKLKSLIIDSTDTLALNLNISNNIEHLALALDQIDTSKPLKLANLKSMDIQCFKFGPTLKITDLADMIGHSPNLTSLSLQNVEIYSSGNLTLRQLKKLCIKGVIADALMDLGVAKTSLLEDLIQNPAAIEILELDNLNDFLISQDFPHLQEFSLKVKNIKIEYLKLFLQKQHPHQSLKKIILTEVPNEFAQDQELVALLKQCPNVSCAYANMRKKHPAYPVDDSTLPDDPTLTSITDDYSRQLDMQGKHPSSPLPPRTNSKTSIDADTKPVQNKTFDVQECFQALDGSAPPLVNHYRLEVYNQLEFAPKPAPFSFRNTEQQWDKSRTPCQTIYPKKSSWLLSC